MKVLTKVLNVVTLFALALSMSVHAGNKVIEEYWTVQTSFDGGSNAYIALVGSEEVYINDEMTIYYPTVTDPKECKNVKGNLRYWSFNSQRVKLTVYCDGLEQVGMYIAPTTQKGVDFIKNIFSTKPRLEILVGESLYYFNSKRYKMSIDEMNKHNDETSNAI